MTAANSRRRVLIVEDEMMVAMLVEDILTDLGCELAGLATHLDEAVRLAGEEDIDFAMLDVNLGGKPSYSVAEILKRRGIPFVFATGYGERGLDPAFAGSPTLQKPFQHEDIERVITQHLGPPSP